MVCTSTEAPIQTSLEFQDLQKQPENPRAKFPFTWQNAVNQCSSMLLVHAIIYALIQGHGAAGETGRDGRGGRKDHRAKVDERRERCHALFAGHSVTEVEKD